MRILHLLLKPTLRHFNVEGKVCWDKLAGRNAIVDVAAEC